MTHSSRRKRIAVALAVLAATVLAAGPSARADQAWFSFQGTMAAPASQQDFVFTTTGSSALVFKTYQHQGGTNTAGQTVAAGGIDSVLTLYDNVMAQIGYSDDYNYPPGRDSMISISRPAGTNTLRLRPFADNSLGTGLWAADLINTTGSMTVTTLTPTGNVVTNLTLGATGAATATLRPVEGATMVLSGGLTIRDRGLAEVVASSQYTGIDIRGATTVASGGLVRVFGNSAWVNFGGNTTVASGGRVEGVGPVGGPSGMWQVGQGTTFTVQNGGWASQSYLDNYAGTMVADGAAAVLNVYDYLYMEGSLTQSANLTLRNGAKGTFGAVELCAPYDDSRAFVRVESGAEFTATGAIAISRYGEDNQFGAFTVTGSNSKVIQTGAVGVMVGSDRTDTVNGGLLEVNQNATFTTGTGPLVVERSGTVTLDGGSLTAKGNIAIVGGRFERKAAAGGYFSWQAPGGTLDVTQGGVMTLAQSLSPATNGTVNVSGLGSRLETNGSIWGKTFNVTDGGTLLQSSNNYNTGITARVGSTGVFQVFFDGGLTITNGHVSAGWLYVDPPTLHFNSGSLGMTGDLVVGASGLLGATPTLAADRSLATSGVTTIDPGATLTLAGGEFSTGTLVNHGTLAFDAGTFALTGENLVVGTSGPFGAALTLPAGKKVWTALTTSVAADATLTLTGGGLTAATLSNAGTVVVGGGSLATTAGFQNLAAGRAILERNQAAVFNGPSSNAGRITLGGGVARLAGTDVLTNTGMLAGEGEIAKPFANAAAGQVTPDVGHTLLFSGNASNAGQINLNGGAVLFTQPLTNAAGATITGRGTLGTGGAGLTNLGSLALSAGTTDVYGDVTNPAGGRIVVSGGGTATFWDDVVHQSGATFKVSAGCAAVFFGNVSGNGSYSGTGTLYMEGDLKPGNSPAVVEVEGDLVLGDAARLVAELAGRTPGSQYDVVDVGGLFALAGEFDVTLLDGFAPAYGDTFDLLDWGSRAGEFDALNLPALGGGLAWDTSNFYSSGTLEVVPEPATLALLGLGALAALARRRRR